MQQRSLYLFTLGILIWFGASLLSAEFGSLNYDEAWYLTASHLVFQGQLPYRDFAFTQGPLLPYFYGAILRLVGPSLAIGRFVSVGLATLALALVLNITHKIAGTRAAILAFVLLIATPHVLYYLAIVKTYSLTAGLTLLALAGVLHSGSSAPNRAALLSTLVAGLAVLTRLSFLPVLVLVFLFWVWQGHGRASGIALVVLAAAGLVIAASSNGNVLFDILEFHIAVAPTVDPTSTVKATLAVATAIVLAPALVLAVLLFTLWVRVPAVQSRLAAWSRAQTDKKILLLLVAIALGMVHFVAPGDFWEYQMPGFLLVVVLLAAMSAPLTHGKEQPARTFLLVLCIVVSSAPLWIYRSSELWGPTNTLLSASKASKILSQRGTQGNTVLGMFNHLALASGLEVYPGNEMGRFSVAAELSGPEATLRHFLSKDAVTDALNSCSATFTLTDRGRLFPIAVPSTLDIPAETESQWRDLLRDKYRMIYSDGEVRILERIPEKCTMASVP